MNARNRLSVRIIEEIHHGNADLILDLAKLLFGEADDDVLELENELYASDLGVHKW